MKQDSLRIWRSSRSVFYKNESLHAAEVYTPGCLAALAEGGFNAVWISAILRDLVPTRVFSEWGGESAAHLRSLRTVIRRADKLGMRVFLYMQPPMGMAPDAPFWSDHPQTKGVTWSYDGLKTKTAMCVSAPGVKRFIREAARTLSARLPGLGGAIVITASEYMSHCYSHYAVVPEQQAAAGGGAEPLACPRCVKRLPGDVVADIITALHDGFRQADHGAKLIVWNWSWSFYEPDPQVGIIKRLPRDVTLLAGFERGGSKLILGKRRLIDEYSLSFAGPSDRFVGTYRAARARGIPVMARLQIGTTHELATVPNLPLMESLYEKAKAMRRHRVRAFMGCWNFGNLITANTVAFNRWITAQRLAPRPQALTAFARDYFPGCDAGRVLNAWQLFGRAMNAYPFCVPFLYDGPLNYAVVHPIVPGPLDRRPVGPSWLPAERGDDLGASLGCYTLSEIVTALGRLSKTWWEGVRAFEKALADCKGPAARQEVDTARMAGHCFQSGWNLYRAYRLRKDWTPSRLPSLRKIMRNERDHLADAADVAQRDPRMGFHIEPKLQMFDAAGIRAKQAQIDGLLHGE